MVLKPRIVLAKQPDHTIQRSHSRCLIFFAEGEGVTREKGFGIKVSVTVGVYGPEVTRALARQHLSGDAR